VAGRPRGQETRGQETRGQETTWSVDPRLDCRRGGEFGGDGNIERRGHEDQGVEEIALLVVDRLDGGLRRDLETILAEQSDDLLAKDPRWLAAALVALSADDRTRLAALLAAGEDSLKLCWQTGAVITTVSTK